MKLLKKARCILLQAGLSKDFQAEVINMTCYLINRSSLIVLEVKTLYEVWSGSLVDYSKLRVLSCLDNAHFKKDKLGSRVRKYKFLSYIYLVKGYWLWCVDPKSSKFTTNKDI